MNNIKFLKRTEIGKKFSRRLRINNQFPAIIYGKKKKEIPVIINNTDIINIDLKKFLKKKIQLIDEKKKTYKVKILDIQYHPYKNSKIIHIDFLFI
ncbi:50S ribosomal protein L25 [Enterobacteriaceae endosymbiont of Donacia bicoloricornis]|uniref:50S ribosomal protein L25 n=1 Tax=Enterobacteriaceae endosymbiont of Donacia bicoloricornis TaxID=2675772 RepID=UPI0014493EA0|nr:50S ribosomal protein L25 [Enterobacteriaceae endosymbiont of Donacia bicoloricornis]QJC37599.1 50S ribosomal protein L25 [Enterobacteriaceae endosymbiont of Donacia bicoloricornis]